MSKVGSDSIKRVDGMFSVSGSAVAVGGIFKGDVPFCVVDSDFSLLDSVTGVLVKRYTRDEVSYIHIYVHIHFHIVLLKINE